MCFFARMSGILSSLNKSGQFMSDEKKKSGFWSWFGLGKNKQEASAEQQDHAPQEVVAPQEQAQVSNEPEAQETTEKTTALSDEAATSYAIKCALTAHRCRKVKYANAK